MIASERALFIMRRINELGVVNLKDIAAQMGTSPRTAQEDAGAALDWVDAVGIAAAREGCGQQALPLL